MPEDLNASYERTLLRLCSFDPSTAVSSERLVFRILVFVAFCGRPVTMTEAAEFAVIENSADKLQPDDRFEDPIAVLSFVGSLVNVQDSILTLAHKSVKDFLESKRALFGALQLGLFLGIPNGPSNTERAADIYIAQKCFGYLALPHVSARQAKLVGDVKDPNTTYLGILRRENPLLEYAAYNWSYHVRHPAAQERTRLEMFYALKPKSESLHPSLWQGWLFLQRADIWERQVNLAAFICKCFICSSLVDGWANNFWQRRQDYRVINTSSLEMMPTATELSSSVNSTVLQNVFGPRSKQFHDLALVLSEIAFQKSLYPERQAKLRNVSTVNEMSCYMNDLEEESKRVVPRMGEGYREAISECLKLVMHRDMENADARPLFQMQRQAMDSILQPLNSSATSGFRISRGIQSYKAADINDLFAKVEQQGKSQRFSTPNGVLQMWDSTPTSGLNSFSRTHNPDGSVKKLFDSSETRQSIAICYDCRNHFLSKMEVASHKAKNNDYCRACSVCLPSTTRSEHDRTVHSTENRSERWTVGST